jgi:hypothetical protein
VQERDASGNWSNSGSAVAIIDLTPPVGPTVTASSPTTDTTPTWSWTTGGGGNGTYRWKLDNSDLSTGASSGAGSSFTPAQPLAGGSHTLYVQERDAAGNWSTSGSATVDVLAPPIITAPSYSNITAPTWTWSTGGGGNGIFRWKLDDADLTVGASTGTAMTFTATPLGEGNHTLYIQERDIPGNWSTTSSHTIVVDLTAPTVSMTPSANHGGQGIPIALTVLFSEPVTGFNATDLVLVNCTVGAPIADPDQRTYTVPVYPGQPGTVQVDLPASAAQDLASNPSQAASSVVLTSEASSNTTGGSEMTTGSSKTSGSCGLGGLGILLMSGFLTLRRRPSPTHHKNRHDAN